jgi:hypothetical protein
MALAEENENGDNPRLSTMCQKTNEVSVFRQIVIGAIQFKHRELGREQKNVPELTRCLPRSVRKQKELAMEGEIFQNRILLKISKLSE